MFTCDQSSFSSSKKYNSGRHVKNIHDTYSQKEKGIKRKHYPEQCGRSIKREHYPIQYGLGVEKDTEEDTYSANSDDTDM